jgi:hypothetical protein
MVGDDYDVNISWQDADNFTVTQVNSSSPMGGPTVGEIWRRISNTSGNETAATPAASPGAGAVSSGTTVSLSTSTGGAAIYYTTNGNTPTTSSTAYTSPIPITSATTIKAIAVKSGMTNSDVLTASYTISGSTETSGILIIHGLEAYNGKYAFVINTAPINSVQGISYAQLYGYESVQTINGNSHYVGVKIEGGSVTLPIYLKGFSGNNFVRLSATTNIPENDSKIYIHVSDDNAPNRYNSSSSMISGSTTILGGFVNGKAEFTYSGD